MRILAFASFLAFAFLASADARTEIEIDLSNQKAYLIEDGEISYESPISSGRSSHPTPTGIFKITEKDIDHRSSLYGKIVDSKGRVIKADADIDTPVPSGGNFVKAPMRYFLRFNGAIGMHAGILPGYPASHGCVRLPSNRAAIFYEAAQIGTPVRVYGKAAGRTTSPSRRDIDRDELERFYPDERPFQDDYRYRDEYPPLRRRQFFFRGF